MIGRETASHVKAALTSGLRRMTKAQMPTGKPTMQQKHAPGMMAMLPAIDSQ